MIGQSAPELNLAPPAPPETTAEENALLAALARAGLTPANENGPADDAAARLAAQTLAREHERRQRERRRRRERRRWLALLVFVLAIAAALRLFPQHMVRWLPGTLHLYRALGISVTVPGWRTEGFRVRWVPAAEGGAALAIAGRLRNVSGRDLPMPALTFALLDAQGAVLYRWRMRGKTTRRIAAGGAGRFFTRLADVPYAAVAVRLNIRPGR